VQIVGLYYAKKTLEFERGLKNSLWKRLWTCRKKDLANEINTRYIFELNLVKFRFE